MAADEFQRVEQHHYGNGYNVAGHYFDYRGSKILAGLLPEHFQAATEKIFDDVASYRIGEARQTLSGLELIRFQVYDSDELVVLLGYLCDMAEGNVTSVDQARLQQVVRDADSAALADFALSLLLRLQIRRDDVAGAVTRYRQAARAGIRARAVYFEFIGEAEELASAYDQQQYNLTEAELSGITAGLFRCGEFVLASRVAGFIRQEHHEYNGSVLALLARAMILNAHLSLRCFWILSQHDKDTLDALTEDTVALAEISAGRDVRLYNIIFPLYDFVQASSETLDAFCLRYITVIDRLSPDFSRRFRHCHQLPSLSENVTGKADIGQPDEQLIIHEPVSEEAFFDLVRTVSHEDIQRWIESGGRIEREEGSLADAVLTLTELTYRSAVPAGTFADGVNALTGRDDFHEVSPYYLFLLAKDLLSLNAHFEAAALLECLLRNETDLWCSPLIDRLAEALYNASQFRRLHELSLRISVKSRSSLLYHLYTDTLLNHGFLARANALIEEGLNRFPEDVSLRFFRLVYLSMSGNDAGLKEHIVRFDLSFLENPSPSLLGMMNFLRDNGRRDDIQDLAVRWFIADPEKNARLVSQFCVNGLLKETGETPVLQQASGNCLCGVEYEDNGETVLKVICRGEKAARHTLVLNDDSPMGAALLSMKDGENRTITMRHIRLIRRVPAFVAVFRLSSSLRHQSNDGTDMFCSLKMPDRQEEYIPFLTERLPAPHFDSEFLTNHRIPLSLRAYRHLPNDPVRACHEVLGDARILRENPYNTGITGAGTLFTDLITIVYLAMTSLGDHFTGNGPRLVVTRDTLSAIDEWINRVDSNNFRTMGVSADSQLRLHDSDTVRREWTGTFSNLKSLRESITSLEPALADMPWATTVIRDVLSPISFSEYYAISAGAPPYFTIDGMNAGYVRFMCGDVVCNAQLVLQEAAGAISYARRETGLALHIVSGLPLPFRWSDVIDFARSYKFHSPQLLCRLLKNISTVLPEDVNLYQFTAGVFMGYVHKYLAYSYMLTHVDLLATTESHPCGAGFDRVMYACCDYLLRVSSDECAEEKIAMLTFTLLNSASNPVMFIQAFWPYIANFLQGRFMAVQLVTERVESLWQSRTLAS